MHASGVYKNESTGYCFGPTTLRSLQHSVRRTYNKYPLSIFYADILFMAMVGMIYGNIMRRTPLLGEINWEWWEILSPTLELYYTTCATAALRKYVRKLRRGLAITTIPTTIKGPTIWVIDLCCGFQSRKTACMNEMREHAGCGTCKYIGIDIAAILIAGTNTFIPDWCVDLLDYSSLPAGRLIRTIARRFGLHIDSLLHVFASSPCETNSRLQHCNATRGGASRDTNKEGHPPLPTLDITPMIKGFTTKEKHDLATLHDLLEQRLFSDLRAESSIYHFTFSGENPVGSLFHKIWMADFHDNTVYTDLRVVTLEHCAYGGYFGKSTHHFTNLAPNWWEPNGLTGDGRCGKQGSRTGVACEFGFINPESGMWNHTYAIGRESWREQVPGRLSREQCKNMIPQMETREQLQGAIKEWQTR